MDIENTIATVAISILTVIATQSFVSQKERTKLLTEKLEALLEAIHRGGALAARLSQYAYNAEAGRENVDQLDYKTALTDINENASRIACLSDLYFNKIGDLITNCLESHSNYLAEVNKIVKGAKRTDSLDTAFENFQNTQSAIFKASAENRNTLIGKIDLRISKPKKWFLKVPIDGDFAQQKTYLLSAW